VPSLAETIRRLQPMGGSPLSGFTAPGGAGRLSPLTGFGANPGALDGWFYAPATPPTALVVVLHGCTQTAAGYDAGSGWSDLAAAHGFAVLFPEQTRANNPNLCFNWFNPEDSRRGQGEAESIRQMVAAMIGRHGIDPTRVFVTGLSAGGAMTSIMLATYPEIFAGGGIIAGLPFAAATSVTEALERMRGQGHPAAPAYTDRARAASAHTGAWPRISVWHGDADHVVVHVNADRIVEQWLGLHGIAAGRDRSDTIDGHARRTWLGADGDVAVEAYRIAGMGHGTPLKTGGAEGCGTAGPHMLDVGISSTRHLAASWGILVEEARQTPAAPATTVDPNSAAATSTASTVQATIEHALRTTGLMR